MPEKRTILITGCSDNSLGAALALAFHQQGWRVFASARNTSKLSTSKAAGIECIQLDVTSEESVSAAVKEIQQLTGGSLDALINNAGAGYSTPLLHVDIEMAHEVFELNTFSVLRVTQAFFPLLRKSEAGGLVVNNTSGVALLGCGFPMQGAYNASKAAAASLTDVLRLELAPFGIRVVNLVTGMVKSTFPENASRVELPPDSPYILAKEEIEKVMSGPPKDFSPTPAATWATQVAADLSKPKPPHMLFRGATSGLGRLAAVLPLGWFDHLLNKAGALDVFSKKLQEHDALSKKPS